MNIKEKPMGVKPALAGEKLVHANVGNNAAN